jgi:N-acetylmuramoyl-L-alanine amidase
LGFRHPEAKFEAAAQGHFTPGRPKGIAFVVCHSIVGNAKDAIREFRSPERDASSTYVIDLDGTLFQCVDEGDTPHTNTTFFDDPGSNLRSVTIEHADDSKPHAPRPEILYQVSARLVREICQRYDIPIDRQHILRHHECNGGIATECPAGLDVDRIVKMAASQEDEVTPEELRQAVRDVLNEATAPGQLTGAATLQATLVKVEDVTNKVDDILRRIRAIEDTLNQRSP